MLVLNQNKTLIKVKGKIIKESLEKQCEYCKNSNECQFGGWPENCKGYFEEYLYVDKIIAPSASHSNLSCNSNPDCEFLDTKYQRPQQFGFCLKNQCVLSCSKLEYVDACE